MKSVVLIFYCCLCSFSLSVESAFSIPLTERSSKTETQIKTLYHRLDPLSLSQHLAFYELYYDTPYGSKALEVIEALLKNSTSQESIDALLFMVNKPLNQPLSLPTIDVLENFSGSTSYLPHHKLKGHSVWQEETILKLPVEEIDLARAILVCQFEGNCQKILGYEMLLDSMALQLLSRISLTASVEEKIRAINTLIFEELGFRFPPRSLSTSGIDRYSSLPDVLDSRRGVCLGVSILYLCLAQRLALPLEMITPPGHIFVRSRDSKKIINIETTARGIHLDSKHYLSVTTHSLQQRTIREVIGMFYFNQASIFWQKSDYAQALASYQRAAPYMPEDLILNELMGYALIATGQKLKGEALLKKTLGVIPDYSLVSSSVVEDYFQGNVDIEGILQLFNHPDETRISLLEQKEKIEKTLTRCPRFRAGLTALTDLWLKLNRPSEALKILNSYLLIEPEDPDMHYHAAVLYQMRRCYPKAWHHLQIAERLVAKKSYQVESLKELRRELSLYYPENKGDIDG